MLKVYITDWCPVCERALNWMRENGIPFTPVNIEFQPLEIQEKVIQAGGGNSWRVPTFEYDGKWLTIASFNPRQMERQLTAMGLLHMNSAGKKSARTIKK